MNVAELIARLQKLDPDTLVVRFHEKDGYDECHFIDGTHTSPDEDSEQLKANRAKRVKGLARPDFYQVETHRPGGRRRTRAETRKFVVIY